jgi:hypothetical protein
MPARTQVVQEMLYLLSGTYTIMGQGEFGAAFVEGRLSANNGQLMVPERVRESDADGGSASAPTAPSSSVPNIVGPTPTPTAGVPTIPGATVATELTAVMPTITAALLARRCTACAD